MISPESVIEVVDVIATSLISPVIAAIATVPEPAVMVISVASSPSPTVLVIVSPILTFPPPVPVLIVRFVLSLRVISPAPPPASVDAANVMF